MVHELDTARLYQLRRHMGMMFQAGGLFSDLSIFDNIAFPLREHTKLSEDIIRDLVLIKLHAVGTARCARSDAGRAVGRDARRVALARAIAMDPMLIMYDEPFAGLDPIFAQRDRQPHPPSERRARATSIVGDAYDVSESLKVADHAFFIADGRIAAQGTAARWRDRTGSVRASVRPRRAGRAGVVPLSVRPLPADFELDASSRA